MAFEFSRPAWLRAVPEPGVGVFAVLYFAETLARATLLTIVPVQALSLFGTASAVSFLYTGVACAGFAASLFLPALLRRFARRWVFTAGGVLLAAAGPCLATETVAGQIAGMLCVVAGAAALNVTVSLYILDHIGRQDYARNDAVRIGYSTFGWTVAPYAGVVLLDRFGPWAAYGLSTASALVLLAIFWVIRMSDSPVIAAARPGAPLPPSPLGNLRRFFAQPRLRLAWLIAFARSAFWSTFFIYGPILMVTAGLGQEAGGLLASAGNFLLVTIFWWMRIAARRGVRLVGGAAFLAAAALLAAAAPAAEPLPLFCAALLLAGCFFLVPLDAVGGVPFYRAVRPHERAGMASVYRTYLDMAALLPTLVYGVLLVFFGLGAVFAALGLLLAATGWLCLRHLHPRLR
jgi:predicted MFS family arabinose efflux permease